MNCRTYLQFSLDTAESIRNRSFITSLSTPVTIHVFPTEWGVNSAKPLLLRLRSEYPGDTVPELKQWEILGSFFNTWCGKAPG